MGFFFLVFFFMGLSRKQIFLSGSLHNFELGKHVFVGIKFVFSQELLSGDILSSVKIESFIFYS